MAPVLLCIFHASVFGQGGNEPQNVEAVVARVIESRTSISSGDVHYVVTLRAGDAPAREIEVRTVFDFSKGRHWMRSDTAEAAQMNVNGTAVGITGNAGKHVRRRVVKEDRCITCIPDEFPDGTKTAVTVVRSPEQVAACRAEFIDPRILGFSADSYGHLSGALLTGLFDALDLRGGKLSTDPVPQSDGRAIEAIRMDCDALRGGAKASIWISPMQRHGILRAEIRRMDETEGEVISEVRAESERYSDVWFPKTVAWRRLVGDHVVMSETIKVVSAKFNQPIEESEFSLEALDVKVGTTILDDTIPDEQMWDGTKPVPLRAPETREPIEAKPDQSRWRFVLAINGALIAMIGLAIAYHRKAGPRSQGERDREHP